MQPAGELSVTYRMTERDALWFVRYNFFRERWLLVCVAYLMLVLPISCMQYRFRSPTVGGLTALGGALVLTALLQILPAWWVRRSIRKNPHILQPNALTLTPDGIHAITERGEADVAWSAMLRIANTRDYLLLYYNANLAQIVPRRVFPHPDAAEAFLLAAQVWHANALAEQPRRVTLGPTAMTLLALVALALCITLFPLLGAFLLVGPVLVAEALYDFRLPGGVELSLLFGGAMLGLIGGAILYARLMRAVERPRDVP